MKSGGNESCDNISLQKQASFDWFIVENSRSGVHDA